MKRGIYQFMLSEEEVVEDILLAAMGEPKSEGFHVSPEKFNGNVENDWYKGAIKEIAEDVNKWIHDDLGEG